MKVMVFQRPWGTLAVRRWPRGAHPRSGSHIGLGPGLVDEDQPLGFDPVLILGPLRSPASDIGTILFTSNQRLFL